MAGGAGSHRPPRPCSQSRVDSERLPHPHFTNGGVYKPQRRFWNQVLPPPRPKPFRCPARSVLAEGGGCHTHGVFLPSVKPRPRQQSFQVAVNVTIESHHQVIRCCNTICRFFTELSVLRLPRVIKLKAPGLERVTLKVNTELSKTATVIVFKGRQQSLYF